MSLRLRLNLLLIAIFVLTLAVGAVYVMSNTRRAVKDELQSSIELSSTLIALMVDYTATDNPTSSARELIRQVARIGHTRHLHIEMADSNALPALAIPEVLESEIAAPQWFVQLVQPEPIELVRSVRIPGTDKHVIVRADAGDEIAEAWRESRLMLTVLGVLCVVANGVIYLMVGRSLKPLRDMPAALAGIERGEYQLRVARTGLLDIDLIAERFNHMAEALERSQLEMTRLASRSLAIQEEERRHLAHELHDEMGQSISAIKALAVSISQRASATDQTIVGSAATIANVSTDIYDRVRNMMMRLRPVILDELGLVTALQNMIDDWNAHHEDTFCRFTNTGDVPRLSGEIGINLFRIVQEALTNVVKHAHATEAEVSLALRQQRGQPDGSRVLELTIADNGAGFPVNATPRGLGLVGIFERARALHADLQLISAPNQGTQFKLKLMLNEDRS